MKRCVLVAVDDLFFAAKIRTAAEHLGVETLFPRTLDALRTTAQESAPALVIVDLHLQRYDPFAVARQLKGDETLRATPIVGFFSHVRVELQQRASESGFDRVMPRSAFSKRLPEILQGQL